MNLMKALLAATLLTGAIGVSAQAAPTSGTPIQFHNAQGSREYAVISKLYGHFMQKYPDVSIQSAALSLGNKDNGKPVGSIVVRFVSAMTCQDQTSCLTTVLNYRNGKWQENYSRHTKGLWVGGPSPTEAGDGIKTLTDSSGLLWRWIGLGRGYFPDPASLGQLWPDAKGDLSKRLINFAKNNTPDGIKLSSDVILMQRTVSLDEGAEQKVVLYNDIQWCTRDTCPFIIVTGNDKMGYQLLGQGMMGANGVTLPLPPDSHSIYHPFAVQDNDGYDLSFYTFKNGSYSLTQTTWPTAITPIP